MKSPKSQEIIDRNGLNLKQEIGLALNGYECKDIIKNPISKAFSFHAVSKLYSEG